MKAMVKSVIDEMAAAIAASELPAGKTTAGNTEMAAGIAASELSSGKTRAGATEMAAAHVAAAHMASTRMCRKTARVSAAATVIASQSGTACEREYDRRQRCVKKFHLTLLSTKGPICPPASQTPCPSWISPQRRNSVHRM
jgi:hypothetical protein